jgi:hypothetical protein
MARYIQQTPPTPPEFGLKDMEGDVEGHRPVPSARRRR